jgi:hypothetical protein
VVLGLDNDTKEDVAIKVEKWENEDVKSLEHKVVVLKRLVGVNSIQSLIQNNIISAMS